MDLIESLNRQLEKNPDIPDLNSGDTVRVHARIIEVDSKGKERERIQVFHGTVIRVRGKGAGANFTVRRIASHGIGVERTFPIHSPRIAKVEVTRRARVHRGNLYYLRDRRGKAARLKEKRVQ
ncbi:MAG: 50S ribosomal protein L19 [Anaerolineae bacterium]|nr:50S ribosomal protein L19 [Anaerolineae bacterium]